MIAIIAYAVATVAGTYNDTGAGKHRKDRKVAGRRRQRKTAR